MSAETEEEALEGEKFFLDKTKETVDADFKDYFFLFSVFFENAKTSLPFLSAEAARLQINCVCQVLFQALT